VDLVASGEEDVSVVLAGISVENVALIERATLELEPGLNAVTGETGAGKTLLATALQMLLGGRARSETVRSGSSGGATVEGVFVLSEDFRARILREALGELAEEISMDEELVLRRTLSEEGRSRCYVCGVGVSVKALASLGELLVSYHGQREQLRLSDPSEQLAILDGLLDEEGWKAKVEHERVWGSVQSLRQELEELRNSGEARLREIDFLRYQIGEIEEARYSASEKEELSRERDRLRNVTSLLEAAGGASEALSGEGGAEETMSRARSELERGSSLDGVLSALLERVGGALAEVEDVVHELRSYLEELEADPGRLEEVETRLEEFKRLERKYGEDVEGFLEEARERLSRLEKFEEEGAGLEERLSGEEERLGELAESLTVARERAAEELGQRVKENLAGLKLGQTEFRAELVESGHGLKGREVAEFMVRPNPGEPELSVRRYASGGELSRIMLAIRLSQRESEEGMTYVFDEIDAGIGGETATAVGQKLKKLGEHNQVLTLTHLPQIASVADFHVVVSKEMDGERTVTKVSPVEGEDRKKELARMLSGRVDEASLAHASELLVGSSR